MKTGKGKTKKILLGLILCGAVCNTACAADDLTFTWDDYTSTVDKNVVEKTYTWTDAEGNEHTVTYKTVDTDAMEKDKTTATVEYKNDGENHDSGISNTSGTLDSVTGTYADITGTNDANANHGAVYNSGSSSIITTINAGFINNNADVSNSSSSSSYAYGGAIYNRNSASIGSITGSYFIGNSVNNTYARGGAIFNQSSIGSISESYFIGNTANSTSSGHALGGAICNYTSGTIDEITESYFVRNSAENGGSGDAEGGAICNGSSGCTIEIISGSYFIGNTAKINASGSGHAYGGAIFNYWDDGINNIEKSYFVGNSAENDGNGYAEGGAIYNGSSGSDITGGISESYFIGNTAKTYGSGYAQGGAIFNGSSGTIEIISGSYFVGNSAENGGSSNAQGGAIYNGGNSGGTIEKISGSYFVENSAESGSSNAQGGAIYNGSSGVIDEITGSYFVENSAESSGSSGSARGGAILNNATIGTITSDFIGNWANSASGYASGGAIYNTGTISSMEGTSFIGNYAKSTESEADGGAIYNAGTIGAGEGLVVKDLIGNYAQGTAGAKGGAIYDTTSTSVTVTGDAVNNYVKTTSGNVMSSVVYLKKAFDGEETSVTVNGDVIGNHAETESGTASGGAFYNNEKSTLSIGGDISGNWASASGDAKGGAIYNAGTLTIAEGVTISGNYAVTTGEGNYAAGGAIYNEGSIDTIEGAFTGNYASASGSSGNAAGGAIYNTGGGTITSITATALSGNYATSEHSYAEGGAIYNDNSNTAITVTGDIADNYVKASTMAAGGAIYSMGNVTVEGGSITGNYAEGKTGAYGGAILNSEAELTVNAAEISGNYAAATTGNAAGGAIYNIDEGTLTVTATSIANNYAKSESGYAKGGAIYNEDAAGSITVTGDVTGNYADASGTAAGGAIYNAGTLTISGNITGNYASGDTAQGGAIYNAAGGEVNINIENQDAVITGNYTESGGEKEANVLYGEEGSVTNFSLKDATLRLDDSLTGETGYEVNVTGNGTDATTFYMLNDILDSNLSFSGTTLNTINNEVKTYSVNKFTVAGDFNMVADVDLANETMDRFVTNGNNYGDAKGSLNVSGMNLISDTTADRVGIYFAEPGLKENVTSSVGQLPGSEQQTAYTPLYQYNVTYDKNYDGSWGDDGGYFVFDKTGNNPAAMMPTIAQMGLFNAMNMMFEYCFEHSDYYMKLPSETRLAIREKAKAARAEKLAAKNGTTVEEETQKIDDARAEELASREVDKFYDHDNVLPLYDQHELTRPGAWVKTFATKESIPFTGKFTAKDKYYGGIIGVDSDFREDKKGWGNVFTGYAGYQGIHQSYSGGSIRQDGGMLGATETFYKKNFYTAWTIAAASTSAKGRNMYGHESSRLYTYGIATKSGWNLEYDGGKYIVLPTFMASYTTVDMRDYTNAAGLKVDADNMRAVQLNPNIKWIRNYSNGWQPYLTAGEVWTVGQKSRVRVDGTKLDELHLRPYTEYGLGVQKRWAHDYDGYAEFLGHAGGRRGFLAKIGFRWTF